MKNLTIETTYDIIDITPLSEPNPDWEYTDRKNHTHKWDSILALPTLNLIIDSPASEEYSARFHRECKFCGEHITPGYRPPPTRSFTQGEKHQTITYQ